MGGHMKRLLGNLKKEARDNRNERRAQFEQERVERHRQSAADNVSYRALPLSPLMDPVMVAARQRHRTPKAAQGLELTPFQKKLAANPYAQALATSVRKCIYTNVRMPAFFHIKFHAVKHPKTGAPWFVPDETVVEDLPFKTITNTKQEEHDDLDESENPETYSTSETKEGVKSSPEHDRPRPQANGSAAYMLARQSLLHQISRKAATRPSEITRIIPPRWRGYPHVRAQDTVWREDMDTYYLNILRRTVLGKLRYLHYRNAGYLVTTVNGLHAIPHMSSLGAVLWLGDPSPESDPENPESTAVTSEPKPAFSRDGPEPYVTVKYKGHHIPLYNMQAMLGEEILRELVESDGLFATEFVMLKAKANTVTTRMLLWKLQIYTAYFEDGG